MNAISKISNITKSIRIYSMIKSIDRIVVATPIKSNNFHIQTMRNLSNKIGNNSKSKYINQLEAY